DDARSRTSCGHCPASPTTGPFPKVNDRHAPSPCRPRDTGCRDILGRAPTMLQDRRALVVEDDRDARTALCDVLREWGYATEGADDVDRALALARTQHPNVVVVDLWLHDEAGDALDVVAEIRALDEQAFIVVFSGWQHLCGAAMAAGADAYILKPD